MSDDMAKSGEKVFRRWCVECHGAGRLPGTNALQRKYQGALPAVLEQRNDLTDVLIRVAVRNGMSFMPFFRKTEISERELIALSTYLVGNPLLRAQTDTQGAK